MPIEHTILYEFPQNLKEEHKEEVIQVIRCSALAGWREGADPKILSLELLTPEELGKSELVGVLPLIAKVVVAVREVIVLSFSVGIEGEDTKKFQSERNWLEEFPVLPIGIDVHVVNRVTGAKGISWEYHGEWFVLPVGGGVFGKRLPGEPEDWVVDLEHPDGFAQAVGGIRKSRFGGVAALKAAHMTNDPTRDFGGWLARVCSGEDPSHNDRLVVVDALQILVDLSKDPLG